jgi:hypothetical protein
VKAQPPQVSRWASASSRLALLLRRLIAVANLRPHVFQARGESVFSLWEKTSDWVRCGSEQLDGMKAVIERNKLFAAKHGASGFLSPQRIKAVRTARTALIEEETRSGPGLNRLEAPPNRACIHSG